MIISFSTHKGGTGKTTSSINLASALARAGNRTLLIDLDPQGHSSIGLGLGLAYEETNIADVLKTRGGWCQVDCVKFSACNRGKFLRTFPTGLDRQLSSIFKEIKANKV